MNTQLSMLRTTNFAPALTPRTCLKRTQELALRGYVSASHFPFSQPMLDAIMMLLLKASPSTLLRLLTQSLSEPHTRTTSLPWGDVARTDAAAMHLGRRTHQFPQSDFDLPCISKFLQDLQVFAFVVLPLLSCPPRPSSLPLPSPKLLVKAKRVPVTAM